MQYFLYARKSSDSEDRQILSIEAQIEELRDFAERNGLNIVKVFTESMSAKKPGRPVFNQMLNELEAGKAQGIISWHPDRIARNTYDGGKVTYLIDLGIIQDLKFPNFYFDKTANGKFNLSIAFSQAQYFIDGLKENVNRGIRQKIRRGEFPGKAPYGYINDHKTRKIEPNPETFELIKKLLTKFAHGDISQKDFRELLYQNGMKTKTGNPLAYSSIYHILQNPFYYGVFKFKSELQEGTHQAMISKETHDKIQERLKLNPKKLNFRKNINETKVEFLFPAMADCGECGFAITYEHHKKSNKVFKYYRCTHKSKVQKCTQRKYLSEEKLAEQVKELTSQISIDDDIYEKLKAKSYEWALEDKAEMDIKLRNYESELQNTKNRLNKLLDLQLDAEISLDEYKARKNSLVEDQASIQDQIAKIKGKASDRLEPELSFLKTCNHAFNSISSEDFTEMSKILKKTGSNRKIRDQKLSIQFLEPFNFLSEFKSQSGNNISHEKFNLDNHLQTLVQSRDSLAQQDSPAVSERASVSWASSPKGCEPVQAYADQISDGEWYRRSDLNRHRKKFPTDFKSVASTDSATSA